MATVLTTNQTTDGDGSAGIVDLSGGSYSLYLSGTFDGKETIQILARPDGTTQNFITAFSLHSLADFKRVHNFELFNAADVKINILNTGASSSITASVA